MGRRAPRPGPLPRNTPPSEGKFLNESAPDVRRGIQIVGLVLAMACALFMVAYVGYGEAWRTYPRIELDRLAAQDETVRNALDPLLKAGLPLGSIAGFGPLTTPLLASDSSIAAVYVILKRRPVESRGPLALAYGVVFFLMAVVVVYGLVSIYSDGIRDKTEALGNSLGRRLSAPLELGLPLDDFSQVDVVFKEYKDLY